MRPYLAFGGRAVAFAVLYVLLDGLSFVHDFHGMAITPWNPNSGLAVAFLLHFGPRHWPIVGGAALIADLSIRDMPLELSVLGELAFSVLYGAASLILLRRGGERLALAHPRDMALFLFVVAAASLLVAASRAGLAVLLIPVDSAWVGGMVIRQWIGDMIGIALVTPLALLLLSRPRGGIRFTPTLAGQLAAMAAAAAIVFGWEATDEFKFFYLLFIPLVWGALTGGLPTALVLVLVAQLGMILATSMRAMNDDKVVALQFAMLTAVLTGSFLGATADARRRAELDARERLGDLARLGRIYSTNEIAAGLAHEIKQPMLAIVNYVGAAVRLLEQSPPNVAEALRLMRNTDTQVARADGIIRRMRDFVQKGENRIRCLDIAEIVQEAMDLMLPLTRRHGIAVEFRKEGALPPVVVDDIQILQVVVNLLSNSITAIAEAGGPAGTISVAARLAGRSSVEVAVSDSGPGLPEDVADSLFQPFMTTRPEGVGIGLSISKAIVEAHDGRLWYDRAASGAGATFRFTLPADDGDDEV
ncbi:ATP-binding protein [Magnetospirillum sp. SS-4]|uniref:ATP-binding protein n=1 Tax=Magnetospirillum sp. SS-4 TaxID=2681465 RepID=UPI001382F0C4|nr:ATP-binding protein [Magnetospirillum sp. SS-4]CAA7620752.1 putative Two-component sensor histidine kinase [Magnetospirillum sp. SS-4]